MNKSNSSCMNRMQDGRQFTDYRPRCTVHYETRNSNKSSLESRMFLMNNAEQLIRQNMDNAIQSNTCNKKSCMPLNITPPEKHEVKCNHKTCTHSAKPGDFGIGTGRNYATL